MSHSWPKRIVRAARRSSPCSGWACPRAVLWALVREPGAVFFAFVFVFLLAFSAWFVLTRRRIGRVLGIIGVFVTLLGLIGFAGKHGLLLAILFGSIVLFGLPPATPCVTRMQRWHSLRFASKRRGGPVGLDGVLIINPSSGGGKAEHFRLAGEAKKRGIEPLVLRPGDDLGGLAEQAVHDGADVIGMAGGDGSQALVASVAMRHDVAHVCVPAGTRNNFARELGLDRDDVSRRARCVRGRRRAAHRPRHRQRARLRQQRLARALRAIVQSDAYRDAKLEDMAADASGSARAGARLDRPPVRGARRERMARRRTRHRLQQPVPVKALGRRGDAPSPRRRTPRNPGDPDATRDRPREARHPAFRGQVRRFGALRQWSAAEFEVHSAVPVAVGLDGESSPHCAAAIRLAAGRIARPHPAHAQGVSPAGPAVTLSSRDLTRLLRIAAGRSSPDSPASDAGAGA